MSGRYAFKKGMVDSSDFGHDDQDVEIQRRAAERRGGEGQGKETTKIG